MKRSSVIILALALVPVTAAANQTRNLYVSPTGSDSTDGSYANPWATVQHAISVSTAHGWNAAGEVDINLLPGQYVETTPITIGVTDGGTSAGNLVIRSLNGLGGAQLRGGTVVTGWTLVSGSIYKAPITGSFWTIYENGTRAIEARSPNYAYNVLYPSARPPWFTSGGTLVGGVDGNYAIFAFQLVDLPTAASLSLSDTRAVMHGGGLYSWFLDTAQFSAYGGSPAVFTLTTPPKLASFLNGAGSRYYVEGDTSLLDAPGEWYHDRVGNFLYYWARDGAIANQEIVVPTVQDVIVIAGTDASHRASYVTIDGLTVQYSDFVQAYRFGDSISAISGPDGYGWWRTSTASRHGLVFLSNTDHITITNSHLLDAGLDAIHMREYGQQNVVSNDWIEHCGLGGVMLDGHDPEDGDVLNSNMVSNVLISNTGELASNGMGVMLNQTSYNLVQNVEIYNTPRNGIRLTGAGVAADGVTAGVQYTHDNVVQYVRLHDNMQDSGDAGALGLSFYANPSGGPYQYQTVNQVTCDAAVAETSMGDVPPNCLFNDNDSYGQHHLNEINANTQGAKERDNASGSHVALNVDWTGSFDESLMYYANIGTTSAFPWQCAPNICDGFETPTTRRWTVGYGSTLTSTEHPHSGSYGYATLTDQAVVYTALPRRYTRPVSMSMYDGGGVTGAFMARADLGPWSDLTTVRGIGVDNAVSTTNYVYVVGSTATASSVARSTGFHELRWDYTASGVDLYLDNVLVASPAGVTAFNTVAMGDWRADGVISNASFDDPATGEATESFEHDLGAWTADLGSPVTSTGQAYDGTHSLIINQDGDVVHRIIEARQYKTVTCRLYDDASDTSIELMARVDETPYSSGFTTWNNTAWRGLGVNTATSTTKYVYRVGATTTATSITRTTGWHTLSWDYRSGGGVNMAIDGFVVAPSVTGVRQFNMVALGDFTASDGLVGTGYFDECRVGY